MSTPVAPVDARPGIAKPQPAEQRETPDVFAGVFEEVKRTKSPEEKERRVEEPPDRERASADSDGAQKTSQSDNQAVAPVHHQREKAADPSPRSSEDADAAAQRSAREHDAQAGQRAGGARQSLLQVNQELDLMLKFRDVAARAFALQSTGATGRETIGLETRKTAVDPVGLLTNKDELTIAPPMKSETPVSSRERRDETRQLSVMKDAPAKSESRTAVQAKGETGTGEDSSAESGQPRAAASASTSTERTQTDTTAGSGASLRETAAGKQHAPSVVETKAPTENAAQPQATAERAGEPDAAGSLTRTVASEATAKLSTASGSPETAQAGRGAGASDPTEIDLASQIVQSARLLTKNGQQSIEIHLKPDVLGKLFMRVEVVDRVMSAQMTVQSEQVKNMIESQLQSLQAALDASGLRLNRVEIHVVENHRFDSQQSDGGTRDPQSGLGEHGRRKDPQPGEKEEPGERRPKPGRRVRITI